MSETNFAKNLENVGKKMKSEKGVYLVVCESNKYNDVNEGLLIELLKKQKLNCLYVTLNKRYDAIEKKMKNLNIDTSNIYFIDGISVTSGKTIESNNCTFVQNISSLTEMSLGITVSMDTGKFDFVFFDSINTLLIYNELKSTEKFVHYMINKFHAFNIGSILISLKANDECAKIMPLLSQISDSVFDF